MHNYIFLFICSEHTNGPGRLTGIPMPRDRLSIMTAQSGLSSETDLSSVTDVSSLTPTSSTSGSPSNKSTRDIFDLREWPFHRITACPDPDPLFSPIPAVHHHQESRHHHHHHHLHLYPTTFTGHKFCCPPCCFAAHGCDLGSWADLPVNIERRGRRSTTDPVIIPQHPNAVAANGLVFEDTAVWIIAAQVCAARAKAAAFR